MKRILDTIERQIRMLSDFACPSTSRTLIPVMALRPATDASTGGTWHNTKMAEITAKHCGNKVTGFAVTYRHSRPLRSAT